MSLASSFGILEGSKTLHGPDPKKNGKLQWKDCPHWFFSHNIF